MLKLIGPWSKNKPIGDKNLIKNTKKGGKQKPVLNHVAADFVFWARILYLKKLVTCMPSHTQFLFISIPKLLGGCLSF